MQVEKVLISKLNPAKYNPRKDLKPGDTEYEKLKRSMAEFGYIEPIIRNKRTGNIVEGHQRHKILKNMKYKEAECVIVDLDDNREKALNVALNKISGEFDIPLLTDLLKDLSANDFDVSLTGFDENEISDLLSDANAKEGKDDDYDVNKALEESAFVKQGDLYIYSLDSKGELLLTIMSSLAQEESRSISENVTWGHRKRFAEGRVLIPYGNFLGYKKGEDGLPRIVPEEAKTIKLIYKLFLEGKTPYGISQILKEQGILSPRGKKNWSDTAVLSILMNEKYKGDALLQKCYTVDFLTKKRKKNEGEVPQYYVKNSHEAIISPEIFDLVQAEIDKRKKLNGSHSGHGVFSSKIVCDQCGEFYGPRTFHSNSKYRKIVWQCKTSLKKGTKCEAPLLYKEHIEKMFVDSFNKLLKNKDEIINNCREFVKSIDNTQALETEKARLCGESRLLYEKIQNYIDKNATETLNQNIYKEHYNTLSNKYEEIKQKIEKIDTKLKNKRAKLLSIENFLNEISERENLIDTFDEKLFTSVVDKIIVKSYTQAATIFRNGQELSLNLEEYK